MTNFSSILPFFLSSCSLGHLTSVFVQICLKIVLLAYEDTIDRACGEPPARAPPALCAPAGEGRKVRVALRGRARRRFFHLGSVERMGLALGMIRRSRSLISPPSGPETRGSKQSLLMCD